VQLSNWADFRVRSVGGMLFCTARYFRDGGLWLSWTPKTVPCSLEPSCLRHQDGLW